MKIIKNGQFSLKDKAFIIVPEGISHDFEKSLCENYGNSICKDVEVLTFSRLCKRVFEKIGGGANSYLNDAGRILAVYKAMHANSENLRVFKAKKPDIAKHLLDIIDEFKVQSISEEDVAKALEKSTGKLYDKLYDLYCLYVSYNEITSENSLDPRDEFQYLINNFYKTDDFDKYLFHFAGFDIFTPKQYEFIDELIAKDIEIEICFDYFENINLPNQTMIKTIEKLKRMCITSNHKCEIIENMQPNFKFLNFCENVFSQNQENLIFDDVFLHTAENITHECMYTASTIIELLAKNSDLSLDDFVITARNFDKYKSQIQMIFERLAIPIYISDKNKISNKYPISFIFETFDAILSDFSSNTVIKYLKNPIILDVKQVNTLRNYIKRWNIKYIRKNTIFRSNPSFKMRKMDEKQLCELKSLNDYKNSRLIELFKLADDFKKCKTGADFIEKLYNYYEEIKLPYKILNIPSENLKIKQEFNQIWDILVDSLEQFNQIYGDFELTLAEFFSLYKNILNSYEISTVPASVTSVYASSFNEVRKCKYLFVLGANSTDLPKLCSENAILTNREKEMLHENGFELAEFGIGLNKFEYEMIFKTLIKASEGLYISYSEVSSEKTLPAEIFKKGLEIVKKENISSDISLDYSFFYKNKSTALEKYAIHKNFEKIHDIDNATFSILNGRSDENINIQKLSKSLPKNLSPTQIEQYNTCQFKYFLKYAMKLEENDEIEFNNLHNGNFVHYILEKFIKNQMETNDFNIRNEHGEIINISEIQEKIDYYISEIKNAKKNKLTEEELLENNLKYEFFIERKNNYITQVEERFNNSLNDINLLTEEYFDRYFSSNLNHDKKSEYDLERIKNTVFILVSDTVKEIYLSSFKPRYCEFNTREKELNFTVKIGDLEYNISGTIDRLDQSQNTVKIVDYKSGKTKYNPTKIVNGLDMQMLIYALVLEQNNFANVSSVLYSHMIVPTVDSKVENLNISLENEIKRTGVSQENQELLSTEKKFRASDQLTEYGFRNLLDTVSKNVEKTALNLTNGSITANPYKIDDKNSCQYCKFSAICGFYPEYNSFRTFDKVKNSDFEIKKEGDDN